MVDGDTLAAKTKFLPANTETSFKLGDRVLVLFGDTSILGTIYDACSLTGADGMAWNVRTDASNQTYPIHEGFLSHALVAAN